MKKCSIVGPTVPYQSRRKFYVCGHSTLPVLWHADPQYLMEFGDLMYSVGRIEDGIKRGKIVDTGASMREKKRIVPNKHVQAMFREERRSKRRSHRTREEPIKNHPRSPGYAQVPLTSLHSPPKVRTGIWSRVWLRLLPEQEKKKDQSVPHTFDAL